MNLTRSVDEEISSERANEIYEAELEGRLVVLPCKVGDTVYALQMHKEIVTAKVTEITLRDDGIKWLRLYSDDDRIADYRGENLGKTVFLAKEEAEAALKEEE